MRGGGVKIPTIFNNSISQMRKANASLPNFAASSGSITSDAYESASRYYCAIDEEPILPKSNREKARCSSASYEKNIFSMTEAKL